VAADAQPLLLADFCRSTRVDELAAVCSYSADCKDISLFLAMADV
jgi:hypothetical protein